MTILVINWQDRTNPFAGGAETHLHEIFSRIVRRGHRVVLLCCSFPGSASEEVLSDGIEVVRRGSRALFNFIVPGEYRAPPPAGSVLMSSLMISTKFHSGRRSTFGSRCCASVITFSGARFFGKLIHCVVHTSIALSSLCRLCIAANSSPSFLKVHGGSSSSVAFLQSMSK